jgi:hypothetical protein
MEKTDAIKSRAPVPLRGGGDTAGEWWHWPKTDLTHILLSLEYFSPGGGQIELSSENMNLNIFFPCKTTYVKRNILK